MAEKYVVIANKLELELKKMRSEGVSKLPSENSLAEKYSCSRQTVRAALDILLESGLIEKRTGSGSYIVEESHKNKTVYFITEDCDRYLSPALISGLRSELAALKYTLKAFSTFGSSKEEAAVIMRAVSEKAAAIIIEPVRDMIPNANEKLIEDAMNSRIPVIYINSSAGPSGVIHIAPGYREAGKNITEELKSMGRKNIACIFCTDSTSGIDGYKGYLDAVPSFDDSSCLLLSRKEEKEILSGSNNILSSFADEISSGCDAVICQNGLLANSLAGLLTKKGNKVPSDITVCSLDNYRTSNSDFIFSMGYDNSFFCKKLAKTAVALAEGGIAKDIVIPLMINA